MHEISEIISKILNPTISFQPGNMSTIPVPPMELGCSAIINDVESNVNLSHSDWDSYETSWDFKKHPMV